ncbi:hypothetical protein BJY52DRAFT_1192643 [Lactarius psammicola]|nr:hypothetical protein BJY52DRAFT_1192643 [Lactarius psammicola]
MNAGVHILTRRFCGDAVGSARVLTPLISAPYRLVTKRPALLGISTQMRGDSEPANDTLPHASSHCLRILDAYGLTASMLKPTRRESGDLQPPASVAAFSFRPLSDSSSHPYTLSQSNRINVPIPLAATGTVWTQHSARREDCSRDS